MSNNVPTRIAHFRLESLVGEGGVGVVYRAVDDTLGRTVALKVLADPEAAESLITEARHVSKLSHPAIAAVYEAGTCSETGLAFVAFEWVPGSPLRAMLRAGPLSRERLVSYGRDLASAVAHAHESGLVHGDLKADNVVIGHKDRVKLLDFGLAAPLGGIDDQELWGTPACMSPELLDGGKRTEHSDLFALGVLLYEMSTGKLPFGGEDGDDQRVRSRQAEGAAVDPREHQPELAPTVAELITGLLSLSPEERGPSAVEVERRMRLEAKKSHRSVLPTLIVLLLLIGGPTAWLTRDSWIPRTEEPQSLRLQVGDWTGLAADQVAVDSESRFGTDLLRAMTRGEDPGSAILQRSEPDGALRGAWGRRGVEWVAEWDGHAGARSRTAGDPVSLATTVVAALEEDGALFEPATTLCDNEQALREFVVAVRATQRSEFHGALATLNAVIERGPDFPEARAWRTAAAIVTARDADEVRVPGELGDYESEPARTLTSHFISSPPDRSSRWVATHALAKQLDAILLARNPQTPDSELEGYVAGELSTLAMPAALELCLATNRLEEARSWVERIHARLRREWRQTQFLFAIERAGGPPVDVGEAWVASADQDPDGQAHLRMCYDLARNSRDAFIVLGRESFAVLESAALVLAISGRFKRALEVTSGIYDPFDPSRTYRVRAAVQALAGEMELAFEDLERARQLDPDDPRAAVLIGFLEDPWRLDTKKIAPSRFARWRANFGRLAEGRRLRSGGEPREALSILEQISWVDWKLEPLPWPELPYLAWLERIECRVALGELDRARSEMYLFRRWWPEERASSRVSRRASEVDRLLEE